MRATLANFGKTEGNKNSDNFTRFENRGVSHRLSNCDVLDTDKFRLQVWLAIFEKHANDFLKVAVQLVESFALRVSTGETRDKPNKKLGLWATFNYS